MRIAGRRGFKLQKMGCCFDHVKAVVAFAFPSTLLTLLVVHAIRVTMEMQSMQLSQSKTKDVRGEEGTRISEKGSGRVPIGQW